MWVFKLFVGIKAESGDKFADTCTLQLYEDIQLDIRFSNFMKLASSINFKISSVSKKLKVKFVWEIYSIILAVPPWDPAPLKATGELMQLFHFTTIYPSWKKCIKRGTKLFLIPSSVKEIISWKWDCLSNVWTNQPYLGLLHFSQSLNYCFLRLNFSGSFW